MKAHEFIQKLFNEKPKAITLIPSGLTNNNYKVSLSDKTVVLRLPKPGNASLFDYEHEAIVLEMIRPLEIDTPLIYYNKQTGIKCSTFIQNSHIFADCYTERATRLIQRLHSLNKRSGKTFDIKGMVDLYLSQCAQPKYDLTPYTPWITNLKQEHLTLCHNDCVQGNFLFTDSKDYLIDYEYAMDNDPLFDLMSFITENDIQDPEQRQLIYETYFETTPSPSLLKRLTHFEIVHHILWCTWAMMMCEKDDNPEFIAIRDLKYQRLQETLATVGSV